MFIHSRMGCRRNSPSSFCFYRADGVAEWHLMKTPRCLLALLIALTTAAAASEGPIVLENAHVRYTISPDGKNLGFVDRATDIDYLRPGTSSSCALVRRGSRDYPVTAATFADGKLTLAFGDGVAAVLKVEPRNSNVRLTVESVRGPAIDSLVFLNVPLKLQAKPEEPFGACAFSLNLFTRVDALPALQSELRASCHRKFGLEGAQVAIVGMPTPQILSALKEVLSEAKDMPLCTVAGPWAREVPFNHGSYLFNFGTLTEATVGDWIDMVKSLGFTQIDNHGGSASFFRFGDFELNREKWPDGWEAYRRIVARLHGAGIGSIFHTYGFFIDKHSKYVAPVPDKRLDAFRSFTVAADLAVGADEVPVNESTAGITTVTGFFEHNSVVLHLDDELVTFSGASKTPPWRFTGVKRGALGTTAATHAKGTAARHLKECFGLFVPNPESTLFTEIAANHADIVNQCDFDGLYLDAIDGSSILRGSDECWYWADKFVFEIQRRLKKPVGMEMSAMWHHFWQYRTRWQAWDFPQRGQKRFVDLHAEGLNGGLLLPLHLGWWDFQRFNPPQVEPTYPDVMEYLGARLIGWDAGISLTGAVDREKLRTTPLFRRAVDILRTCEELRHSGSVEEPTKAKLRAPGTEFALFTDAAGKHRFRRSHSAPHTVAPAEPWTQKWSATNPFAEQPLRVRIEALMSAAPYDNPGAIVVADPAGAHAISAALSSAQGVTFTASPITAGTNSSGALLQATNSGRVARNSAWCRSVTKFSSPLNLKGHEALGVWIEGDGGGELVTIRLESPQHISFGAIADHYVRVDFTGRRLLTLVETESARWNDYGWNDGKSLYNAYRETIDFGAVESVTVGYQDLPPDKPVACRIGPVKALPLVACTLKDPVITVNGSAMTIPGQLASGSWLELTDTDECALYGSKGESLGRAVLQGKRPVLRAGDNQIEFACSSVQGLPRVKVTVFCSGPEL